MRSVLIGLVAATVSFTVSAGANAQGVVRVGVILPYSGQFADPAAHVDEGIKLFVKQNGVEVAGKTVEIIRKDVGGSDPGVAKRLAQELVVRDTVDVLTGFLLTPNAFAAADVSAEARKLMVVMGAATTGITEKSDYMTRVSVSAGQLNEAFGRWAAANGTRRIYTIAADYSPGHDAQAGFVRGFTAAGGTVLGADFTPVDHPDFSAFMQRAKDANPEAIYFWVPGGAQPIAAGRALAEKGLIPSGPTILSPGALVSDEALAAMGDLAVGIISATHYDSRQGTPLNKRFVDAYVAEYGHNPDAYSIGGYDGMRLIYESLKKTNGDADGQALVDAARGLAWESPRGPVAIDAATRDIGQTIYVYKVGKVDGRLANVEIGTAENR